MKKQNVNNKLAFKKVAITELNDNELGNVRGGTSEPFFITVAVVFTAGLVKGFFEELNN